MRIVCPLCKATYEVPATLLGGAPKRVRCARCLNEWIPGAEGAAGESVAPPPPAGHESLAERLARASAAAENIQAAPMPFAPTAFAEAPAAEAPHAELPTAAPSAAHPPDLISEAAEEAFAPPAPRPPKLQAEAGPRRSRKASFRLEVIAALAISAVLLLGLLASAVVWRAELMRIWPPSLRLFAAIGLA